MRKRILSILLALCMVICLVPVSVLADDTALRSIAVQNIGPTEAAVANDLYEKMSVRASLIKLVDDIDIGTLSIDYEVTIDLNGHVLRAIYGGSVFKVEKGGHLTIIDSNPTETTYKFKDNGSGLWVFDSDGDKTVRGGVITGGTGLTDGNNSYGGGVYVDGGGEFTMTAGNIVGCTATGNDAYGGGVYVAKKGTFEMSGGSIAGCTSVASYQYGYAFGGGIRNDGEVRGDIGCTTLSGTAVIRDCHAKNVTDIKGMYGGGISDAGTLTISGDVKIIGCTAGGSGSDAMWVNANNDSSITGGTFYGSITDRKNRISGITVKYHLNSNEDYATQVVQSGDKITLPDPAKLGYTFDGWYKNNMKWDSGTPVTDKLILTGWLYAPVTNETELKAALADDTVDVIRLTSDIKLSNELQITNNRKVTLDMGGYVVDLGGKHISVSALSGDPGYHSNELTIIDSNPTKPHKFTDNDGLWKPDENGDKTVKGGIITGGSSALNVGMRGKVTMNGGSIVGCSSGNCGGGVFIDGGVFEFNDGAAIIGCTATSAEGGGVFMEKGKFTMSGGNIQDCRAYSSSGVYVESGLFELKSGSIQNCLSMDGLAVVYVYMDGTFTMTGGEITGSTANYGIYLNGAKMNANGGTVDGTVKIDAAYDSASNSNIYGVSQSLDGNTGATVFKQDVTNEGKIKHGVFSGTVSVGYGNDSGTISGGTFNGLIKNNNTNSRFGGVHSPLGIVGEKPHSDIGDTYYKVIFDTAGGNMKYSERYFLNDRKISDQIEPDARVGYTFGGWERADGTAWDYVKDTVTENITLYAKWIPHTYKVTFDANGGTVLQKTMQAAYGEELSNVPIPQRYGYVFDGWFDKQNGGKQYCDEKGRSTSQYDKTENCTLYAHWKEVNCKVKFDAKGGTLSGPAVLDKKQNERLDRPDNPVREGYSFAGWYKDADCTKEWNFDDLISGDMTLYAGWTVNSYKITVKPDNGDKDIVISRNFGSDITAPKLTKTGYTFNGWDKEFPKTMPAKDLTITARWKINQYTINFDTAGGSKIAPIKLDYGKKVTKPADPTRKGYAFIDWNVVIPTTMPAKNITVKAIWKDIESPVISGLSDGKAYCNEVKFKVSDNEGIKSVKQGDKKLTADKDGYYTLTSKLSKAEISAEDFEGNITKLTVSVNDGHTLDLIKENGKYFYRCSVCGYETKKNDVPKITDGEGLTVTFADNKPLSFRSTAPIDEFIRAELDGEVLNEKYYTKKEGSTVITLNEDFVSTLSVGKHTLSIVSVGGTATAEFTVNAPDVKTPETSPKTGYSEIIISLIGVAFIFGGIFIKSLKKKA